ncbi:hypothetical protein JXA80_04145 [bacterium]|nr:hypothetical protein [candidate division CSSED10-310 bacterium]
MLIHSALSLRTPEAAKMIFEDIFAFPLLYSFDIGPSTMAALFGIERAVVAQVYDLGTTRLEVFIMDDMPTPGRLQHLCLAVADREAVVTRWKVEGWEVRRFQRDDGDVIFCIDADGNMYELKNRSGR